MSLPSTNTIYLARDPLKHPPDYFIRQSFVNSDGILCYRALFELGMNPEKYIIYIDDDGYYIDDELVEAIESFVDDDAGELLEKLLELK